MEALKNFTGYQQRLFPTNDLNKWVRGGTPDLKWRAWLKDFLGFEIFDSGIFLVNISFTWGFFAYSKQLEVVILMLLMKQKMCPGWSLAFGGHSRFFLSCFFCGGGGGGWFCPHSIIPSLEIRSNPPWELGVKGGVAKFEITQLAFAHLRQ